MSDLSGITVQGLVAQMMLGLINGSFYAILSLGLAIIFGLLHVVNFAHGAQFMFGAFAAWIGLTQLGPWIGAPDFTLNYFAALLVVPLLVGGLGMLFERLMLRRLYRLDNVYGLLLTLGLSLVLEGAFRQGFGVSGQSYEVPEVLSGVIRFGGMDLVLPKYRLWAALVSIGVCFATWWAIERTRIGAFLRAGTENARLLQAFGVNVPRMVTLTYGFGVALAAFAGVLAAPVYQVSPMMGSSFIAVVFAVVVIGGIGSTFGAIVTGLGLGLVEGLTKVVYPEASTVVVFVAMAIVLLTRPAGLFGKEQ